VIELKKGKMALDLQVTLNVFEINPAFHRTYRRLRVKINEMSNAAFNSYRQSGRQTDTAAKNITSLRYSSS